MEFTENLLKEISQGLRYDVEKILDVYRTHGVWATRDIRWKINVDVKGARLNFVVWSPVKAEKRQEAFESVKNYMEKQYGVKLENQRLYTYEVIMDFGKKDEFVDPFEMYTLLKINQALL